MNKIFKPYALLLSAMFFSGFLFSQTAITAIQPGPLFSYYDLWNVTITSLGQSSGESFSLELNISSAKDGLLLSATSSTFQMSSPVYSINRSNLSLIQPINHQFGSNTTINQIVNSGGQFPAGEYHVKFSLKRITQSGFFEPVGSTAYTIQVQDYSSLFLISPYNNDTIYEQFPLFTWVYSNSAAVGKIITYHLRLYEVSPMQSPVEAVYYNPIFLEEQDVRSTIFRYPVSARSLIKLKRYAWQITVKIDGNPVKQSEIWSFVLGDRYKQPEVNKPKNLVYADLLLGDEGGTILTDDNFLKIRFTSKVIDLDGQLSYSILDSEDKKVLSEKEYPLSVKAGENRYLINLCPVEGINLKPGIYTFRMIDEKQKKWNLKFIHQPSGSCN